MARNSGMATESLHLIKSPNGRYKDHSLANAAIDFQRKKRASAVKRLEGFGMGRIAAAESTAGGVLRQRIRICARMPLAVAGGRITKE